MSCLDLASCYSQADSCTDALANIRESIRLWLEVQAEEGGVKTVEISELAV